MWILLSILRDGLYTYDGRSSSWRSERGTHACMFQPRRLPRAISHQDDPFGKESIERGTWRGHLSVSWLTEHTSLQLARLSLLWAGACVHSAASRMSSSLGCTSCSSVQAPVKRSAPDLSRFAALRSWQGPGFRNRVEFFKQRVMGMHL